MSPTRAQLRAIQPDPMAMPQARGVIKVPIFLKLFEHHGWEGAKRKWKGAQTTSTLATFLSQSPDDVSAKYIKILIDDENFPNVNRDVMFSVYRAEKRARAARPHKGRLPVKNVIALDWCGNVREGLPFPAGMCDPITKSDIHRMVVEDDVGESID